jgi:hypothetical protein
MTVLGIVGCRIFEDEIVHMLANDPELNRVYLIENEENNVFCISLKLKGLSQWSCLFTNRSRSETE